MYVRQLFLEEQGFPRIDLTNIISHVLSIPNERVLMEPERWLDPEQWRRIRGMIGERRRGKPLAYLTNRREFYSETFYVDEHVLIPRPETELLVEEALRFVKDRKAPVSSLDMGTGSGIIGILLAKGGAQRVLCLDISPDAIAVARKNAAALGVDERTDFLVSDLFSGVKKTCSFDLICANLPYVSPAEWEELMAEVKNSEPKQALVAGMDGVELYARLIRDIGGHVRPGGAILCEIGSEHQASIIGNLLEEAGFDVAVKTDLAGRQRTIKGLWTSSS